jgi:hypothetical protein
MKTRHGDDNTRRAAWSAEIAAATAARSSHHVDDVVLRARRTSRTAA